MPDTNPPIDAERTELLAGLAGVAAPDAATPAVVPVPETPPPPAPVKTPGPETKQDKPETKKDKPETKKDKPVAKAKKSKATKLSDSPWPSYADVPLRFGCPGRGGSASPEWEGRCLTKLTLPFPMETAWVEPDPHTRKMVPAVVKEIRVHREVLSSLGRVLGFILNDIYEGDIEALKEDGLHLFNGAYGYRGMVAGKLISMHAFGAAIDFAVEKMPADVIEAFRAEGWIWGGDFSTPEPGHFEATRGK